LKTDDRLMYTTQAAWERYRDISRTLQERDRLLYQLVFAAGGPIWASERLKTDVEGL